MPFCHHSRRRRWLTALLLVAYGSAGVLGYGLHALWHCDHCHVASHGHDHAGNQQSEHSAHVLASVEECSVCAFLAQAQSEHRGESPFFSTAISPADPPASEFSELPPLVRLHLARGPPLA